MSIGFAVAVAGLSAVALAILLAPLFRRRGGTASREVYDLAVYRDQLSEIERDLARGILVPEHAEAARAEIARRILALKPAEVETGAGVTPRRVAIVAVLLLPVAAWLLYGQLGSPSLPDQPFAGRGAAGTQTAAIGMDEALEQLRAHLAEHPKDLTGWLLLARAEMGLARYNEAADAYRHAADVSGHRADISGDWGEAQVLAAGGTITPAAQEAFTAALHDPEAAPRSRYYLALAEMQQGKVREALAAWTDLAATAPADAEWLPLVRQRIAEASGVLGIDPATVKGAAAAPADTTVAAAAKAAAEASPEERRAMILAMVSRLASRLESQPDDVEGWARLGRSYMVLDQPEKAKEAYTRAVKLKPDDPQLARALAEATDAAGKAGTQPSR